MTTIEDTFYQSDNTIYGLFYSENIKGVRKKFPNASDIELSHKLSNRWEWLPQELQYVYKKKLKGFKKQNNEEQLEETNTSNCSSSTPSLKLKIASMAVKNNDECPICLETFKDDMCLVRDCCLNVIHLDCLKNCHERNSECPMCCK
jgi:hypothetical protein